MESLREPNVSIVIPNVKIKAYIPATILITTILRIKQKEELNITF